MENSARWNALSFKTQISTMKRRSELLDVVRPGGIGLELGVAEGKFSALMLSKERLSYLYSIDLYGGGHHDIREYRTALRNLEPFKNNNSLLRMKFNQALDLFEDDYFDFIFVDGFADTGEDGGRTLYDWFPKLRAGGVFAGHDYDDRWPKVISAVDEFVARDASFELFAINRTGSVHDPEDDYNRFGTWCIIKPMDWKMPPEWKSLQTKPEDPEAEAQEFFRKARKAKIRAEREAKQL